VVLEYQGIGRPRVRCGSPQCRYAAEASWGASEAHRRRGVSGSGGDDSGPFTRGMGDGRVGRVLAAAGLERDTWAVEAPLPVAGFGQGADIDPLAFPFGWDVMAFVEEFGATGAEVGQTRPGVGPTLGAGCEEPVSF
jgi:hypothetical protein